jgi:hypothetical protein
MYHVFTVLPFKVLQPRDTLHEIKYRCLENAYQCIYQSVDISAYLTAYYTGPSNHHFLKAPFFPASLFITPELLTFYECHGNINLIAEAATIGAF